MDTFGDFMIEQATSKDKEIVNLLRQRSKLLSALEEIQHEEDLALRINSESGYALSRGASRRMRDAIREARGEAAVEFAPCEICGHYHLSDEEHGSTI